MSHTRQKCGRESVRVCECMYACVQMTLQPLSVGVKRVAVDDHECDKLSLRGQCTLSLTGTYEYANTSAATQLQCTH